MKYIVDRIFNNLKDSYERPQYSSEEEFVRGYLNEDRSPHIRVMNGLIDEIHDLDNKIASLYTMKLALMKDVINRAGDLADFVSFTGCTLDDLKEEYKTHALNSNMVQKAVRRIRCLFFDDNKEIFKNVVCIHLKFDESSNYDKYAKFEFYDEINGKRFHITIPDGSNVTIADRLKYRNEYYGGKMYVVLNRNHFDKTVMASYVIDDIRNGVVTILENDYDKIPAYDFHSYVDLPEMMQNIENQMNSRMYHSHPYTNYND